MAERRSRFATTRWSVVLAAQDSTAANAKDAREALATLCEAAWYPLYAYLRRRGRNHEDASDLTQGLFAQLFDRNDLQRIDPSRGRFRSFLLASLEHFVANDTAKRNALKRGGGRVPLSLDFEAAGERYAHELEPEDEQTPERAYEATWARALLDRVMARLEAEYAERSKAALFDALAPCLGGAEDALPYADIARSLNATEGSVKVAVHRLRARFRLLLRSEIAETLAEDADVEEEIRHLFEALS